MLGPYQHHHVRIDTMQGLDHQNSLKSVLEREGEILSSTLYTKWRALYMKCMYIHTNVNVIQESECFMHRNTG